MLLLGYPPPREYVCVMLSMRYGPSSPTSQPSAMMTAAPFCRKDNTPVHIIEAGVTSPLVHHYLKSREQLLAEVYCSLMRQIPCLPKKRPRGLDDAIRELVEFVDANFDPNYYDRSNFLPWLALWQELAQNPALRPESASIEAPVRVQLVSIIKFIAESRGTRIDAQQLAHQFDCLLNGLWISWCLEEDGNPLCLKEKASAIAYLESHLGPLNRPSTSTRRHGEH